MTLPDNRPNIRDVAKAACVSVSTVSRVINGRPDVDDETRQRVWHAIDSLHYQVVRDPDALTAITVIVSDPNCFTIAYWQHVMAGILKESSRISVPVLIMQNTTIAEARSYLRWHSPSGGITGYIITGMPRIPDAETHLGDPTTPVVSIAYPPGPYYTVNIDTYRASYELVKYLAQLGHQRIAFAMADPRTLDQEYRYEGLLDALRDLGLPWRESWVNPHLRFRDIPDWVKSLLHDKPRPTALFVGGSSHSDAIFSELMKLDVSLPHDLSFVGYGHAYSRSHYDIIVQPTLHLGVEAVRLLRQVTARPSLAAVNRLLQAELFRVGSVGPPPAE